MQLAVQPGDGFAYSVPLGEATHPHVVIFPFTDVVHADRILVNSGAPLDRGDCALGVLRIPDCQRHNNRPDLALMRLCRILFLEICDLLKSEPLSEN